MLSRSHLLVEKELALFTSSMTWGLEVSIVNDNIYEWSVKMLGPPKTIWEGGVFRVYVKFDEHYNIRPPRICFHTIPYHPNIDMVTGRPCIDYLDDWELWKPDVTMENVLVQVQNLLANPNTENPVNIEACHMLNASPDTYRQVVRECVQFSIQLDGDPNEVNDRKFSLQNITRPKQQPQQPHQQPRKSAKLSFDDYLAHWNGIATSKPTPSAPNSFLDIIRDDALLRRVHDGLTEQQTLEEEYMKHQQFYQVYYGAEQKEKPPSAKNAREAKMAHVNQMRKIYLPKKPLPTPRSPNRHPTAEKEIDDLVSWTQNLNPDDLDII